MKYAVVSAFIAAVAAQSQEWGQCGGTGWTGPTTCVSGTVCTFSNPYYSQCLPGTAPPPATTTAPPQTTTAPPQTTSVPPATTSVPPATTSSPPTSGLPAGNPASASAINGKFRSHGKLYFGTCADSNRYSNAQDASVTKATFGQVTPENSMKWDTVEASRGNFNFAGADSLVQFGQNSSMFIRGHTFVWASQLPSWVSSITDKATLTSVLQNHITTVMTRYKGKIYSYDVVNEHINEDGTIKSTPWTNVLGNDVFTIAFKAARAADPGAKLYINDYNLDSNNAKVAGIVKLVNQLNANGANLVDGIGSQTHLSAGQSSGVQAAITALAASTATEVALTEVDIASAPSADYVNVVKACLAVTKCIGITVWGVRDPDSWRASTNPLLFDANYQPKAAYNAIMAAL